MPAHADEVPNNASTTQGQSELDPLLKPAARKFESPERFIFEGHVGPYSVLKDNAAGDFFRDDRGPAFGAHLDGIVYRLPKWVYVTVGGRIDYLKFSGNAVQRANGQQVGEETTLSVVPLTATAGVRFDALPRQLHVPIIFGARVGWEWAYWSAATGDRDEASGWALGPWVSAQIALDLDTFEPGGARILDEEWGINHTYFFGEVYHFAPTAKSLELGATSWVLGLGFVF
ncbi:MAG: MXAN_2562 family outer membrane beta-barrel protein [Polyangiales bacterium]